MVQCHAGSSTPENVNDTEFSLELSANKLVRGEVALCDLTSLRTPDRRATAMKSDRRSSDPVNTELQ